MRRAVELLHDGGSAKECAAMLGYKDAAHFSHAFKAHFGVAPIRSVKRAPIALPSISESSARVGVKV